MREKLNYTELIGNDGNVVFSAWQEPDGKCYVSDTHHIAETLHLINAKDVSYDEYLGWLENGHEIEWGPSVTIEKTASFDDSYSDAAEKKIFLIQQGKKENYFKLFEMKNGKEVPSITPVGFSGLDTDYPELKNLQCLKGRDLFYKSHNLCRDGVPLDIVLAIQNIDQNAKVLFSNNYCSGMMEDITNLPKEYCLGGR